MSNKPFGQLHPQNWLNEGDGLYVSARSMRTEWRLHQRNIKHHPPQNRSLNSYQWSKLCGFPRAAMLLLGYSVEMFLKAGLAKAYRNCRPAMFDRDVKRFGHDYLRLSKAIQLPMKSGDCENLVLLRSFVTLSSRYPLFPDQPNPPFTDKGLRFKKMNETSGVIWSREKFSELCDLAKRCREHAAKIDNDFRCPLHYSGCIEFGTEGYICARSGGHLTPRIIFRYSKEMIMAGNNDQKTMQTMFSSSRIITQIWSNAILIEDQKTDSIVHQGPLDAAPKIRKNRE